MRSFGLGGLYMFPTDSISPVEVALLQDVTTDFSFDTKELYGQYAFPVETARGKGKISLKAGLAEIRADVFINILGGSSAAGNKLIVKDLAGTIPSSTAYTITVTTPSSGVFLQNLQVVDVTDTTQPPIVFVEVASGSEDAGKYSVAIASGGATATYTFDETDKGKSVHITYEYSVTTGKTITVTNPVMGVAPKFAVRAYNTYDGKEFGFYFPKCVSSKLSINMKLEDFLIPDFDISAYADGANNVAYYYISEP
jgi:hypothetical protein